MTEEVKTVNDLVALHEHMDSYTVAFVTELNAYIIAVPYWYCQGNFMGESEVDEGAILIDTITTGSSSEEQGFSIYRADADIVKMSIVSGGTFDRFGSSYEFNFSEKTVTHESFFHGEEETFDESSGERV